MIDDYSHQWKLDRGFYDLTPPYWFDDATCDLFDAEERAWRESQRLLPTTDLGWRKFFDLPLPQSTKKLLDRDAIRERTDFARVLELYGVLFRRRGDVGTARCPFHKDQTASMSIHFGRKLFNCFACGEKGDLFRFVEQKNGCTFLEAMRELDKLE